MKEEEVFGEIARNYYGEDGFVGGNNIWLVDPFKLTKFLTKHLSK